MPVFKKGQICEECGLEKEPYHNQIHHNVSLRPEVRQKHSDFMKGKSLPKETRQNISESLQKRGSKFLSERAKRSHTPESDIQRRRSFKQHNDLIRQYATQFKKDGYEVITDLDIRPDIIIRKGCIVKAVEIQRKKEKKHNYGSQKVFDEVVWIPITKNINT